VLDKDEVVRLLRARVALLESQIARNEKGLEDLQKIQRIPRLFLVEAEYGVVVSRAEVEWVRSLIRDIEDGTLWITHEQMRAYEQTLTGSKGGESG